MMTEIVGEAQNARHITTAHFRGRFADFSIERGCFFDDEDSCLRSFALQHEGRRCARKRATDDYHIVFELHPHGRKWTSKRVKAISSGEGILLSGPRWRLIGSQRLPLKDSVSLTINDFYERAFDLSGWN